MIGLNIILLSQSPTNGEASRVQDARVIVTLQDGRRVVLDRKVKVDNNEISIVDLPYDSKQIRNLTVQIKDSQKEPPRIMAWQEGNISVDTTLDAWKDTTLQVSTTSYNVTYSTNKTSINSTVPLGKLTVLSFDTTAIIGARSSAGIINYFSSAGVSGYSDTLAGVAGVSDSSIGVYGLSRATNSVGVAGISDSSIGVFGLGDTLNSDGIGVFGYGYIGLAGYSPSPSGWGVLSVSDIGTTGDIYAFDDIFVYDTLKVYGTLEVTGTKNFVIPHPLDPNKYLVHHALESNEVLNVYRGTVVLDENGEAVVRLPDYFKEININFSYQLTPVGAPMPNLYIKKEIEGNTFVIGGGKPGYKVSWTVYAQRYDEYIRNHPESAKDEVPRSSLKIEKKIPPKVTKAMNLKKLIGEPKIRQLKVK